ncbi:P-loop containing nucleoside triphosphate hydrolase protein [Annulohypoxylon maeteangense]|uniref:P-loop containing nucleoside triphosphate hydrolase protein n=1 Tax=Annulohypoxylon maeteangense TaxID=1927788 RepID=UPI002008DFE7|nr:P-loop containing nucleoside triphosphate hydrolase protein [Annulohypoxylon maeteangense]KAI0882066.1 P-loop containing nucleoside triphosphate hydrolase protein [Annulohypoxylon maeteangense]
MASVRFATPVIDSDSSDTDEYFDTVAEYKEPNGEISSGALDIIYDVTWHYENGSGRYECEEDPCPATEIYKPPPKKPRCVISVSITANGVSSKGGGGNTIIHRAPPPPPIMGSIPIKYRSNRYRPTQTPPNPFLSGHRSGLPLRYPDDDFKTTSINVTGLNIHSPHLVKAMRDLIKYYPFQLLQGDVIYVSKPYAVLLHYYHDLKNLRETHTNNGIKHPIKDEIIHDLTVLVDWLEPHYVNTIQPEEERHRRGVTTWERLWILYKPGSICYSSVKGEWRAFIVRNTSNPLVFVDFSVTAWYVSYDGGRFVRRNKTFTLGYFGGERKITSLDLVPRKFIDSADERHALLASRGQRYHDIMRVIPHHLRYSGDGIGRTGFKQKYDGEIIVDPESWKTEISKSNTRPQKKKRSGADSDESSGNESMLSDDPASDIDQDLDARDIRKPEISNSDAYDSIADWKRLEISQTKDPNSAELSAHQKSLLPTHLRGFALRHKLWMIFDLESAHEIDRKKKDDALKNLIIPDEDRRVLTAVTRKHINSKASPLFSDFIHGKGEGLILLLHGPPGTGKTFTVECISEYTCRPLLSLTVGDIGTKEEQMESRLSDWFNLATRWEAVLLIDEADVFLEKRGLSDLARNSLVSVFLRCMEYYNGMLFLTTNRVGHLDDGFLSRIQVAITYKKLSTESQRKIWLRFFSKINEDKKGDLSVSWEARHYIEEEGTVESMDMNGREIRNALQTAVALANDRAAFKDKESVEVAVDDIKQVASRRQRFAEYINSIRMASEHERALEKGDRNDL